MKVARFIGAVVFLCISFGASAQSISLWNHSTFTPPVVAFNPASQQQLGTEGYFDGPGFIIAVFFYQGANETGIHQVTVFNSAGAIVGSGTLPVDNTSGWKRVVLSAPVKVATAGAHYTAARHYNDTGTNSLAFSASGVLPINIQGQMVHGVQSRTLATTSTTAFPTNIVPNGGTHYVDFVFVPKDLTFILIPNN